MSRFNKMKYDLICKKMLVADAQLRVAHIQERVWASILVIISAESKKIEKKKRKKKDGN